MNSSLFDVEEILEGIYQKLLHVKLNTAGLLTGQAGALLFLLRYEVHKKQDVSAISQELIEDLINSCVANYPGLDFCNGKSGINWLYAYLTNINLIDKSERDILCSDMEILQKASIERVAKGDWDFLSGAIGVAYLSLYNKTTSTEYYNHFFEKLDALFLSHGMFTNCDFGRNVFNKETVVLGLAHGITSILKFCLECIKKNICVERASFLSNQIIEYLLSHTNNSNINSYFPYFINGKSGNETSRLAWCYGDLGIGYILYQYSIMFKDLESEKFALEVLMHSCSRRTDEMTSIRDAGVCHGSAGVAHIFNRLWYYTGKTVFRKAAEYWIERTINFSITENDEIYFKSYDSTTMKWKEDYSLLEGTAGIGLVLLSYLTGDFSWDYCLMLND